MRAGACTAQQTLTSEAASVLKHSLGLARRRGHAQVTPLHVAATLLSPRASLLRRACLKSHPHSSSHPLQCRALELCFNVALNRLPTTPGPLLHAQPSLSNALIAALKRAQAHQRRGCIEQQQQQPLLAIKVELEQLIISILDDPSVSRVMREAGFSSTTVKNNLEDSSASSVFQCYSGTGGIISSSSSSPTETHREIINHGSLWQTNLLNCYSEQNPLLFPTQKKHLGTLVTDSATEKEDFRLILEVLLKKKRRNTVIISDYVSMTKDLVAELMAKVERGEVPDELRLVHFIKFGFSSVSLKFMKREDVETKLTDLRRKVGSLVSGGGAVIYAGDLKWTVETSFSEREGGFSAGEVSSYNPSDHLVAEIGRLLSDYSCSNSKVWLLATSNYQTYMRCQMKQPPLESQWNLQAVSVPSGGLGLSLHASRMNAFQMLEAKPFTTKEEQDKLTCAECTSNFEREARIFKSGQQKPSFLILSTSNTKDMTNGSTHLPYWLQPQRTDTHHKDDLVELKKKWNRLCHNLHHPKPSLFNNQSSSGKSYAYSSSCPWWPSGSQYNQTSIFPDSSSISFTESTLKPNNNSSILSQFGSDQPCPIEFCFENGIHKPPPSVLSLDSLKYTENKEVKISLALGNPLFSDSLTSWNQKREERMDPRDLCKLLQENVPWQSEIIPSIAEALLNSESTKKKGTWLLIQGTDWIGKRRLALATAASICGSTSHLVHMDLRRRENKDILSCKILTEALRKHEKCVVLLEDIDYADTQFIKFLVDGLETRNYEGTILQRRACFDQAIFIVTTSGSPCFIDMNKKEKTVIQLKLQLEEISPTWEVANFTHKRKAEWDLSNRKKHPRNVEKEDASSVVDDEWGKKKELWRQVSSNTLDLNIRAEEEEEEEDEVLPDNSNPNPTPSDVTQATMMRDLQIPYGFLESIEKSFVLDEDPTLLRQMGETFLSKMNESLEEVCGSEMRNRFSVDKVVLEEMVVGSGSFLNGLFEFWLKDIFQTSLITVKKCGKEGTVRLSLGGKGASVLELGFMGSSLPKTVQLAFKDSV